MARPFDYGDQFPSDLADTAPTDPTASFSEVDYDISKNTGGLKLNPVVGSFNPNNKAEERPQYFREVFAGIILFEAGTNPDVVPRFFMVLLYNGATVRAQILSMLPSQYFEECDPVAVIAGRDQTEWFIIGNLKWRDLATIDLTCKNHINFLGATYIFFDKLNSITGKDEKNKDAFEVQDDGNVKVLVPGLYLVNYTLNIDPLNSCYNFDGSVTVGGSQLPGWFRTQGESGSIFGHAAHESATSNQFWRMPEEKPNEDLASSHLIALDRNGDCVELGWSDPGATYTAKSYSYSTGLEVSLVFKKGILTSVIGDIYSNDVNPREITCVDPCE